MTGPHANGRMPTVAFKDIHDYVIFLERRHELIRVTERVSPILEITEFADRASKSSDHNVAFLFENVEDSDIPVLINAFGSDRRTAWALGVERLDELAERVEKLLDFEVPKSLTGKVQKLLQLGELGRFGPKIVDRGPCQELVETEQPSLANIPVLQCWPEDAGRFITLPLVFTCDPETGKRNVGLYRMQIYDDRTTGMHWHRHKGGAAHQRRVASQERMPAAVALGADPATVYAASAPLPPDIDEMLFAGWLRRESVPLVRCKTVDLAVPANAEIVLEGYIDPAEHRVEGPFGDHTGYYSPADDYPVFHLTAVTRRREPIYLTTIVGRPPMEDAYFGKATERIFLPLIQLVLPEVVDVCMPPAGVFHNLVLVSIKKAYPGQARKVMYGLWGMGQLMFAKHIVVVDSDVDVQNAAEVVWRVSNNIDARRDVTFAEGPLDALDHASPFPYYGSKMGIDGTRKLPEEGHPRLWPDDIVMTEEIRRRVDDKWKRLGLT